MTLMIRHIPPSLNRVLRMHRWARKDLKAEWILLVRSQLPGTYLKPIVKMRCRITLAHSRLYDVDNAYGACKVLVDALKDWQLIVDDSRKYLALTVKQTKVPHKQRHTIIELETA